MRVEHSWDSKCWWRLLPLSPTLVQALEHIWKREPTPVSCPLTSTHWGIYPSLRHTAKMWYLWGHLRSKLQHLPLRTALPVSHRVWSLYFDLYSAECICMCNSLNIYYFTCVFWRHICKCITCPWIQKRVLMSCDAKAGNWPVGQLQEQCVQYVSYFVTSSAP